MQGYINRLKWIVGFGGGNGYYYYHYDGLGSVVALARGDQPAEETYSYDVYGKPIIKNANGAILTSSAIGNRYMFTGREYEPETGLYYYRARYYSPKIGRFLQPDPVAMFMQYASVQHPTKGKIPGTYLTPKAIREFLDQDNVGRILASQSFGGFLIKENSGVVAGLNIYTYCGNNPIMYVDPYGLWLKGIIGTIIAGIGTDLLYGVAVSTFPAWCLPVGIGAAVVGVGLIAWDCFDDEDFIDRAIDRAKDAWNKHTRELKRECDKYQ